MAFRAFIFVGVLGALSSCTAHKLLPEGEYFYEGHEIIYSSEGDEVPRSTRDLAFNKVKPEATPRILWIRSKAWFFLTTKEPKKEKGFKHFLKYKLGRRPVYISEVDIDKNIRLVNTTLGVNGFFRNEVTASLDSSSHAIALILQVDPGPAYRFDSLQICNSPEYLCQKMTEFHNDKPIIEMGDIFQKSKLEDTRQKFSNGIKDLGFFYFAPQFILFEGDSANDNQTVKLRAKLKDKIPTVALDRFKLASVTIDISGGYLADTLQSEEFKLLINTDKLYLKPKKLKPYMELIPGDIYSRQKEVLTLKQMNRLDIFDFVSVRYEPDTTDGKRDLHAFLLANPLKKQSVRAEFNLSTTSTNFTGPGVQLEYYNRNIFGGAEKLKFTTIGRYEVQLTGSRKGLASYDFDNQLSLLLPRVTGPLRKNYTGGNVPSTKYRLAYRRFNQPDYYAQSSFGASFGYEWLSGDFLYQDLRLVSIDYVRLLQSSDRLDSLITDGILSPESFQDQVLAGASYGLSYAPATEEGKFFRWAAGGSFESMGNILYLFNKALDSEKNADDQYTVFDVGISQYIRFQGDIKGYFQWNRKNEIAARQVLGLGFPYLNSTVLPFSKQFFVGGASSLRAFQPRSIGPGTYVNSDQDGNSYFDQTGDIQIEFNIENRTKVSDLLEIALFFDMGNVWLKNASESRPGGEFEFKTFVDQMALDFGVGFRLDFDFVLVRLDWGFPLRIPYRPEGSRYVWNEYSISPDWWTNNTLLNFAIGYPF